MSDCPKARSEGLTVESIDNEVLVYDGQATRAHCLNRSAALVWGYCDGETTVAEMAARLAAETGAPADPALVLFALRELAERDLLERTVPAPPAAALNRRQLLMRLGATAAVMVPVVTSLVAPSSAAAQSGSSSGSSGSSSSGSSSGSGSSGGSSGQS